MEIIILLIASITLALFSYNICKSRPLCRVVIDLQPQERAFLLQDLAAAGLLPGFEILSREDLLVELASRTKPNIAFVVISKATAKDFDADQVILEAHLAGIAIIDYRQLCAQVSGKIRLSDARVWEYVLSATPQTPLLRLYCNLKATTEPIIAFFLSLLLLPLLIIIALTIKLSDSGPILFRQTRVGYRHKNFELLKFRTMRSDIGRTPAKWCQINDERITSLGKFLRKTRLDELPQLWNIMNGEMSFIGPRPEQPELERKLFKVIPAFSARTVVKPGISGWAQVNSGYAASIEESRRKLEYDLFYIQNMSLKLDLIIIFRTLKTAVCGDSRIARTIVVELPNVSANSLPALVASNDYFMKAFSR